MTQHWMISKVKPYNLQGHMNMPRVSAMTILKMNNLKQSILGTKRTLYEQELFDQEQASL